jgi:Zn-dependent M28 family amino/carboxypeptidase
MATQATLRRVTLAIASLGAAALVAVTLPASADPPMDPARDLVSAVTLDDTMRHLSRFQQAADRNGGTRAFGSPGHEASAQYIVDALKKAGYNVRSQEFTHPFSQTLTQTFAEVSPNARTISMFAMTYSPSSPAGGSTAPLAVVPQDADTGCTAADFAGGDYTGKIALILRGGCTFAVKSANAAAAGAVGAIVMNNDSANPNAPLNGTLGTIDATTIPTGGVTFADGQALATEVAGGPVTVTLEIQTLVENRTTRNVIAETKKGDKSNVVMLGAHLDSVPEGPGINDNGSGSAAILEIALKMAGQKTKNAVRFAWWSAEEFNLVGSQFYVDSLPQAERNKIALYLNFDMIGSPNFSRGIYDGDDSDHVGAGPGPEGSAAIEKAFEGYYNSVGLPFQGTDFTGRSDYGPFIEVGIPSGGLFTGAEVPKTAAEVEKYGGRPGISYDPCYHQACDTIANVNRQVLNENLKVMAHVTATFANDTSPVNGVASGQARDAGKRRSVQVSRAHPAA